MRLEGNKVLITGGSSGLGFELTKRLINKHNKVLICGRSLDKLNKTKEILPNVEIFKADVSKFDDCQKLVNWVIKEHSDCNILINNAAITHIANFNMETEVLKMARSEVETNLMAPITLSKLFLPVIKKNTGAGIVNITSGLVFAPKAVYPFYNATKAALHSFTQVLRMQMKTSSVSIIEVMFPAVDTPWHLGNPPAIAISPEKAIEEMIREIEKGKTEIKIGKVKILQSLARISPSFALKKINQLAHVN